jgi:quercetin dioxygenase-like cupin family protein
MPVVVPPGAGVLGSPGEPALPRIEVKLGASAGAGFSVVEYVVPAGFSPPPLLHRQTREDAAVYILVGELHYWFVDGDAIAGPGTLVHLPRHGWNRWANEGDQPCRMLAIFAPAGFEQYFLDLSAAFTTTTDRASLTDAIGALRQHYGDEEYGG